jgi:histidine triad (HIT) family protein
VITRLDDATEKDGEVLGKLRLAARDIAKKLDLSCGYRVVINNGPDAGERVPHLHVLLLGKRALAWPPG